MDDEVIRTEQLVRSLAGDPQILALREETLARVQRRSPPRASRWWLGAASLAASLILAFGISLWVARGPAPSPATMLARSVRSEVASL